MLKIRFKTTLLSFFVISSNSYAVQDQSIVAQYQISSAYDDNHINGHHENGYKFYFDRLDTIEDRKLADFYCYFNKNINKYMLAIALQPSSVNTINTSIPVISSEKLTKSYKYNKLFQHPTDCHSELRGLYKELLSKSALLKIDSNNTFNISLNNENLFQEQLQLNENLKKKYSPHSNGTISYYRGHKTPFVFVFIHGLYMGSPFFNYESRKMFVYGNNAFSISFSCQRGNDDNCVSDPDSWKNFSKSFIREIASKYGDKVIIVAHSFGGHIGIQLSEEGLADALILLEPAIKVSWLISFAYNFEKLVSETSLYKENGNGIFLGKRVLNYVNDKVDISNLRIQVPTLIYGGRFDTIVSYSAQKSFAENNNGLVTFVTDNNPNILNSHIYSPFNVPTEMNRILYFLRSL